MALLAPRQNPEEKGLDPKGRAAQGPQVRAQGAGGSSRETRPPPLYAAHQRLQTRAAERQIELLST